jgi:tRNA A37 threonylcarbamoyladenosine dehydratase
MSTEDEEEAARFARVIDLYGPAGFAAIRSAHVMVVGLGGVGSHAALALARSGVGGLSLVDFDVITPSSLNRHPVADPADVGRTKVEVLAEHLGRTCPGTRIESRRAFCDEETLPGLLVPRPSLVVDAIDSLGPKLVLLQRCHAEELPAISSMGASSRRDPGRIRSGDLADTRICPLARRVRQGLRRLGVEGGITCVWSEEPAAVSLPPDLDDLTHPRGRIRNRQPSQITLPGIFGYTLATLALEKIVRS